MANRSPPSPRELGVSLAEWALILALIALVLLGVSQSLGDSNPLGPMLDAMVGWEGASTGPDADKQGVDSGTAGTRGLLRRIVSDVADAITIGFFVASIARRLSRVKLKLPPMLQSLELRIAIALASYWIATLFMEPATTNGRGGLLMRFLVVTVFVFLAIMPGVWFTRPPKSGPPGKRDQTEAVLLALLMTEVVVLLAALAAGW